MKKWYVIFEIFLLMIVLQAIREIVEFFLNPVFLNVEFCNRMITMSVMISLTAIVIFYARIRKTALSILPKKFSKKYIVLSCIGALLLITTPSNYIGGYQAILLLFYGSIVTPIYEEIVFRGYIWNKSNMVFFKEKYTYILNIVLFTIWHLGYMLPLLMEGNINALMWKLAAGIGYGTVLGAIRLKTKNCYSTMLAHGVLNIFMV